MGLGLAGKVIAIHEALLDAKLPHAFGGALALAYCVGEPRATRDVDEEMQKAGRLEFSRREKCWSKRLANQTNGYEPSTGWRKQDVRFKPDGVIPSSAVAPNDDQGGTARSAR